MREIIFLTMFVLLLPFPLCAEEISLSLNEAIDLALRENRSILLKAQEIQKAKKKVAEAKSDFLPSITALATESQTKEYFEKNLTQTAIQATAKQYLYAGGETFNTYQQNQSRVDAAEAVLEKTRAEVVLEVKKAFYSLLLANEFVQLNKMILDNTQMHLDYSAVLYQNGRAPELELLKIKEAFSSVEEAYQESIHQAETLQALLCNLLFIDENTLIKP
ncbi:MAG: TolC family protein, partial [Candidatus Omnitrophota bacterium]